MKIKSTHPESQGPFVVINDEDFDPKTMTEYSEQAQAAPQAEQKPTKKSVKGDQP